MKIKILSVIAIGALLCAAGPPAMAATAHNAQTGAHTKNAYDSVRDARMKQWRARRGVRHAPYGWYHPRYGWHHRWRHVYRY